jgi:hypothetical protein
MLIVAVRPENRDDDLLFEIGGVHFVVRIMKFNNKSGSVKVGIDGPTALRVARRSVMAKREAAAVAAFVALAEQQLAESKNETSQPE